MFYHGYFAVNLCGDITNEGNFTDLNGSPNAAD
jgi:hypothetical protein